MKTSTKTILGVGTLAIISTGVIFSNSKIGKIDTDVVVDNFGNQLITEQKDYGSKHHKFKSTEWTKRPDGMEYKTEEYVTPTGETGYQIFLKKPNGSEKSFGEGPEHNIRDYDWTTPGVASSTK